MCSATTPAVTSPTPAKGWPMSVVPDVPQAGSAEPACGTSGTTDIGQPFAGVGEVTAGVVAEHIVKSRLRTERADQLGGGADGPDATGVDERDLVAVVLGLVHVVRGHQHGHALGVDQRRDPVPDRGPSDRVEADGGLVEYQQPGAVDERLRQLEAAHHAAGVGAGQPVRGGAQADELQYLLDHLAASTARHVE